MAEDFNKPTMDVLATKLELLGTQVNKLEAKLDAYASHFVTAEVYELRHRELEIGLSALSSRVDSLGKNKTSQMWLLGTFSGAAGIILSFLVEFFLSHSGH